MKTLFALFLLFLATLANAEVKESYAPIVGYNPNQGLILGAAAFLKSERDYTNLQGMGTFNNVYAAVVNYRRQLNGRLSAEINNDINSFYDLYFGEGMQTRLEDKIRLDQLRYLGSARVTYKLAEQLSLAPMALARFRRETGVDGDGNRRLIEGEDTFMFGAALTLDARDNEFSPDKGVFAELRLLNHPTPFNKGGNFSQAELDLRGYHSIGKVVLAAHMLGNYSWGNPTYLYRYQLGGSDVLRGFYGNRFRGKNMAAAQLEARVPIWAWLSGVAFADTGEASDGDFKGEVQTSFGGGIRIALPPSGMMKARIDYGQARDQAGIYVAFGHAF